MSRSAKMRSRRSKSIHSGLTVEQLQRVAKKRGIKYSGLKRASLLAKLRQKGVKHRKSKRSRRSKRSGKRRRSRRSGSKRRRHHRSGHRRSKRSRKM